METINKTSSEILLEAADLLEQEGRWGKNIFFSRDVSVGCKMCAHGAISFCGDPTVKELVFADNFLGANSTASQMTEDGGNLQLRGDLAQKENLTVEQYILKHYGETILAHYKAYKVGLSMGYNDISTTKKQDVINKLREAALL